MRVSVPEYQTNLLVQKSENLDIQERDRRHNLCSILNIIRLIKSRRITWVGHVAHMGDEKCIQDFSWKPEGKTTDTPRCRWVDTIKMDLKERGTELMDWIHPAQDTDQ
jgi:hypothetical protein